MPPFTWGLNNSRTGHKALPRAAGKGCPQPDPSPCPRDSHLGPFLPSEAACPHRAHDPAADRQRASLHQILKRILHYDLYFWSEFNTQKIFSAPSLQPLKQLSSRVTHCRNCSALWFTATRGCCQEQGGDSLEKKDLWVWVRVVEEGERHPTAHGAAPEQKSPVRTGKCCRKHEGTQRDWNTSL